MKVLFKIFVITMSVVCACPPPSAISAIPAAICPFKFDQVVKIWFQRKQATPNFDLVTNLIESEASWTPLFAASDDTKVTVSPFISGLTFPMSESIEVGGGDNSSVFGLPEYQGEGNIVVEGMLKNVEPARLKILDEYVCESLATQGSTNLTAYFLNRFGQIIHNNQQGFPIYNFRVSSLGSEGLNSNNTHAIRFNLVNDAAIDEDAEAWDRDSLIAIPEATFKPLTITG